MKKIKCLYFILMLICGMDFPVFAQNNNSASGKTYALIIGISQYQNTNIPRLNYADKDATLFAGWLKSKSGGAVPDYQVRLLIGEDASIAAIYNALDWLTKNVSENDQVYLYFSGHGDVEIDSSNISRGYLLAWNSPSNNYTNNAIRVEDINKLANTLSINNKAKVILITDACHSGKMAGDFFKGKQLTARNLQTVLNNEVRMASCAVDEEAAEGPAWGGGRGVFSYYLLQGLNGMANDKKNDTVTVKDLSSFLTSSFAADKDLAREKHKQHPVIDGNPYFPVAVVDSSARNIYKAAFAKKNAVSSNPPAGLQSLKSLGPQPVDYFIQILKSSDLESQIDFEQYINTLPEKIPGSIVEGCLFFYQSLQKKIDSLEVFKNELNNKRTKLYTDHYSTSKGFTKVISMQVDSLDLLISSFEKKISDLQTWEYILNTDSLNLLLDQVQKNKFLAARFNEKFIQAIHEKAQDMINAYLTGDIAELERRQYYYSGKRSYGSLIPTLHLAATLAPQNDYLFQILKTQYSYISGLANRLQMAISPKQDSLLNAAFKHQYKALQLEPYAAYIHNELGNLYMYKKNYDSAEYHFNIAVALAPTWAIPWSNRIRMNLALNKIDKAKEAIEIANSLQPDLAYVHVNAGLVMEKDGNWLAAESYYLNAIAQNNVHYLPFERLGNIYIKTGEYAKADYYLYETKKRKDQFAVNDKSFSMGIELGGANPGIRFQGEKLSCPVKPAGNNNQILPYTLLATALQNLNSPEANLDDVASTLKKVIQIKPGIPLAHHYLGRVMYEKENWPEAKKALLQSLASAGSDAGFYQPIFESDFATKDRCLLDILGYYNFHFIEDHYLLGSVYEKLDSLDNAIEQYRIITAFENNWQMNQAVFNNYVAPGNVMSGMLNFYGFNALKIQQSKNNILKAVKLPIEPDKNLDYSFEIFTTADPGFIFVPLRQTEWAANMQKRQASTQIIFYELVDDEIVFSNDPGCPTIDLKIFASEKMEERQRYVDGFVIYQYETPIKMSGSLKAARLSEQAGHYLQAEQILLSQVFLNRLAANARQEKFVKGIYGPAGWAPFNFYWLKINRDMENEMYNFYTRMMNLFPRDFSWKEKAGLFLYRRLALTYHQMPIDEQTDFYEESKRYAYPYMAADDTPDQPDIVYELPGTAEKITIQMPVYDPVKNAAEYLQQSIQLSGDEHPPKKILEPLAELNSWLGNEEKATQYYSAVIDLQPADAKFRNKYIDYLILNSRYPAACAQLDSLYKRKQISHEQIIKLAEFEMLKKPQTDLSGLLKNYSPKNKDEKNNLMLLYAKQNLLQGNYKKALSCLQDSIKNISRKEVSEFAAFNTNTDPAVFRLYASAGLYAYRKQDKKSLQTLKQALDSGFNYRYVLDTDKTWDRFRKTKQWNVLLSNYSVYINYENINPYSEEYRAPVHYRFPKLDIQ